MSFPSDIFGLALTDYFNNDYTEDIVVHLSIAEDDLLPLPYLFRSFDSMPAIEKRALELCKGKILDVGCSVGSHSLWLQEKGYTVTGIDVSEGVIALSRKRGLQNAINVALLDHTLSYDTILLLMNGTGIFESTARVHDYLMHLKGMLHDGGQILIDSTDIKYMFESEDGGFLIDATMEYYGEVQMQLSYKGLKSAPFNWLYLDYTTLEMYAKKNELNCELIIEGDSYNYLARLTHLK